MKRSKNTCETLPKHSNGSSVEESNFVGTEKIQHIREDYSDEELQYYLLQGVSRTFALTIPELPDQLQTVISNAYLLCRIVDTIEDSALSSSQKQLFCEQFTQVVRKKADPNTFAKDLAGVLGQDTKHAEHELIWLTERVIAITHHFDEVQQQALQRCVDIMAEGMVYFQENASPNGLKDMKETERYCYCVAGVVGEMLTELFCFYSPKIAQHRERLLELSVPFGMALQMTNILKDIWTDYERSVCWLPRSVFKKYHFDLTDLPDGRSTREFQDGLEHLIGRTNVYLHKSLEYTLLIPPEEKGIRRFCLWSLGMSVLTLRKINKNKDFSDGEQVKISRNSVKGTIMLINTSVKHDHLLKFFFKIADAGLPYHSGAQ